MRFHLGAFVAMWRDRVDTLYARPSCANGGGRTLEIEQLATAAHAHLLGDLIRFVDKLCRQTQFPAPRQVFVRPLRDWAGCSAPAAGSTEYLDQCRSVAGTPHHPQEITSAG